ncbi:ankyrin repeat domain-containing protein [Bogoriella caseilytica]|uniref:Uncharacterized protein n=1 Tax=Bogoriella caseilytica TaxID=56055 RepID=A0A3N2B9F2_9MICO|nr:ankyrin repeat domain-containing protein [Bogoriella caseilytica]ROR71880.1 hypothetical protein EDD31_0219 [Bogoriella caseilytica]
MTAPDPEEGAIALALQIVELARSGQTEDLAAYLEAGAPVNLTDPKGDTLLILAAYHQHGETLAELLRRGADVERVNDRGQTALAAAVFRQDAAGVRQLLDAGADPDQGDPSARATATFFDLPEMTALLERAKRAGS